MRGGGAPAQPLPWTLIPKYTLFSGQPLVFVDLRPEKPLLSGTNPHPKPPFIPENTPYTGQPLATNAGLERQPGTKASAKLFPVLVPGQQAAGKEGPCPEPPAHGRLVAAAFGYARRRCPKAYIWPSLLSCRKPFPALRFPVKQLSLLNNIECRGTSSPHRELGYIVSSSHFVFIGPTTNENKLLIMKNKPLLQHSTPRISNNYVLRFCNEFVIFVPSFSHADDEIQ